MIAKFGLQKLETSFSGMVRSIFSYLEPHNCDGQTNGRTDILIENAVARPKRRITIQHLDNTVYRSFEAWPCHTRQQNGVGVREDWFFKF